MTCWVAGAGQVSSSRGLSSASDWKPRVPHPNTMAHLLPSFFPLVCLCLSISPQVLKNPSNAPFSDTRLWDGRLKADRAPNTSEGLSASTPRRNHYLRFNLPRTHILLTQEMAAHPPCCVSPCPSHDRPCSEPSPRAHSSDFLQWLWPLVFSNPLGPPSPALSLKPPLFPESRLDTARCSQRVYISVFTQSLLRYPVAFQHLGQLTPRL